MEFFKKFFKEMHDYDNGESAVLCPFPHTDENGNQYYETVPSAHVNLDKDVFHCKVCGKGMSEAVFLSKLQGISYKDAIVLLKEMNEKGGESFSENMDNFKASPDAKRIWTDLGLTMETAEHLQIGFSGNGLEFPVFIYGELLDVRDYMPGRKNKVLSRRGAKNLLLPFDLWIDDSRPTLLCAGEKDMAIARQMGFNAITFTGGEQAFPKLFKASFRDKDIYIVYDNDQAGHEGARKIASLLKECGARPHVVTAHYEVCAEKGEDIHDFFIKHARTGEALQAMLDATPEFTEEEHRIEEAKRIPLVTIEEATKGEYANRLVSSRVSVTATFEEAHHVPEYVELTKMDTIDKQATMDPGEKAEWFLDESNAKDILELMDSGLKQEQITSNLKRFAGINPKEKYVRMAQKSRVNVFKAVVTDDMESEVSDGNDETMSARELLVYSIGEPLRSGQKYRIYYKPVAHPLKGQQVVGVVVRMEDSDTSVNRFQVNDSVIETLRCFQVKEGETVKDKMNELYERAKGIIGVEARKDVTFATELFFNTPLEFYFNKRRERAYLDVMVIGDPRTGKSQAAKKLLDLYELGIITSLKTATKAGLIGGSDQTAGGWKTKLGLIPRNHKGAVIMEEFSGGGPDIISQLTEVRSSNKVRITRVNGTTVVPAMVRMLSISNPITTSGGTSLPIKNYANGIKVLLDLIGASEDIARYDFFLLVDEPDGYTSPLASYEQEPFPKESYQNRVRWVWSRKPEQIQIDREVEAHIWNTSQDLNKVYDCHIKLFGAEAWKKLARIAIATAGMVASMDETGEKLVVKKEHVDWAKGFMIACYDNKIFKLREYVEGHRRLVECDEGTVSALENMYRNHPIMLSQLEMETEMSQRQLQMVSGLDQKEFAKVINQMAKYMFFTFQGEKIVPTQKFRTAMGRIDRSQYMPKVGEY